MSASKRPELVAFGRAVRVLREAKGLSQEGLAGLAGLHRTYIGGIERGERNISLLNVFAVSNGLGVSVSVLLQRAEAYLTSKERRRS
jgi:transcriptional regulator with XRE-family HTH domain